MNRVKKVSRLWEENGRAEHEQAVHTRRLRRRGRDVQKRRNEYAAAQRVAWLESRSRKDLLAVAAEAGIKGRTRMTKQKLVEVLI